MGSDHEIGENAARASVALPSSACNILLEGATGGAPDSLVEIPIHRDRRFGEKGIKE
jgi:hypothetical protein